MFIIILYYYLFTVLFFIVYYVIIYCIWIVFVLMLLRGGLGVADTLPKEACDMIMDSNDTVIMPNIMKQPGKHLETRAQWVNVNPSLLLWRCSGPTSIATYPRASNMHCSMSNHMFTISTRAALPIMNNDSWTLSIAFDLRYLDEQMWVCACVNPFDVY